MEEEEAFQRSISSPADSQDRWVCSGSQTMTVAADQAPNHSTRSSSNNKVAPTRTQPRPTAAATLPI